MDIAEEIARYLVRADFGTALGTDVFVGYMPSDATGTVISVMRIGGQLNNYVPLEETALDIYCKATSAETAVTTLEDIKRFIHRMHTTLTNNAYVYTMIVISDIEDADRDLEYGKIFKITVSVTHRDLATIS